MQEICLGCNLPKYLENRKYKLCTDCNFFRIHNCTRFEYARLKEEKKKISLSNLKIDSVKTQEIKLCDKCNKYPEVNKTHHLCEFCNRERLDRVKVEKGGVVREKKTTIKQQTNKESSIKLKLGQLKREIEEEALENDTYFCQGCGKSEFGLDKSHILSVKQRKDLELIKENIQLMCRSCHEKWESWDIKKMITLLCFRSNLEYISRVDKETFNKLTIKIEEYGAERERSSL